MNAVPRSRSATSTLVIAAALLALPGLARAQAPAAPASPETGVQAEKHQRRVIVPPRTDVEAVERDVDRAVGQTRDPAQLGRKVLEGTGPAQRRPDLNPDVTGGIQTRSLNRAR
jgi:hypothetical protein